MPSILLHKRSDKFSTSLKHVNFKMYITLFLYAMDIPSICLSVTMRKTFNICKHIIDIRLWFRMNIPLNIQQNFGFDWRCIATFGRTFGFRRN